MEEKMEEEKNHSDLSENDFVENDNASIDADPEYIFVAGEVTKKDDDMKNIPVRNVGIMSKRGYIKRKHASSTETQEFSQFERLDSDFSGWLQSTFLTEKKFNPDYENHFLFIINGWEGKDHDGKGNAFDFWSFCEKLSSNLGTSAAATPNHDFTCLVVHTSIPAYKNAVNGVTQIRAKEEDGGKLEIIPGSVGVMDTDIVPTFKSEISNPESTFLDDVDLAESHDTYLFSLRESLFTSCHLASLAAGNVIVPGILNSDIVSTMKCVRHLYQDSETVQVTWLAVDTESDILLHRLGHLHKHLMKNKEFREAKTLSDTAYSTAREEMQQSVSDILINGSRSQNTEKVTGESLGKFKELGNLADDDLREFVFNIQRVCFRIGKTLTICPSEYSSDGRLEINADNILAHMIQEYRKEGRLLSFYPKLGVRIPVMLGDMTRIYSNKFRLVRAQMDHNKDESFDKYKAMLHDMIQILATSGYPQCTKEGKFYPTSEKKDPDFDELSVIEELEGRIFLNRELGQECIQKWMSLDPLSYVELELPDPPNGMAVLHSLMFKSLKHVFYRCTGMECGVHPKVKKILHPLSKLVLMDLLRNDTGLKEVYAAVREIGTINEKFGFIMTEQFFVWSILTLNYEIARECENYLSATIDRIPLVLFAVGVFRHCIHLEKSKCALFNSYLPIKDLKRESSVFEGKATEYIDLLYTNDDSEKYTCTLSVLTYKHQDFGGYSIIDLAKHAKAEEFLAHPACEQAINKDWKCQLYECNWWRLLLVVIFPPFAFCFNEAFRKNPKSVLDSYTIPVVKYTTSLLSYIVFVVLFSIHLMTTLDQDFHIIDYILILWILGFLIEEIYQISMCLKEDDKNVKNKYFPTSDMINQENINENSYGCSVTTLKHFFKCLRIHFNDFWNIQDVFAILLFSIGTSLRWIQPCTSCLEAARIILAFDIILFYIRILHFLEYDKDLGPLLVMMKIMVTRDLFKFMGILILVLTGYGVAVHSIRYPNSPQSWSLIKGVYTVPYFQIFGELFLEQISSEFECETNQTAIHSNLPLCPSKVGSQLAPFMLGVYILITNVLLLNLLIAMFSKTYSTIQTDPEVNSVIYRQKLHEEFQQKSALPPPLNILNCVIWPIRKLKQLRRCCHKADKPMSRCCVKKKINPTSKGEEVTTEVTNEATDKCEEEEKTKDQEYLAWANEILSDRIPGVFNTEQRDNEVRKKKIFDRFDKIEVKIDDMQSKMKELFEKVNDIGGKMNFLLIEKKYSERK